MSLRDVIAAAAALKPKAEDPPPEDDPKKDAEDPPEDEPADDTEPDPADKEDDDKEPGAPSASRGAGTGARAEERARIRAILSAPEASANPGLAAHLALETDTSAKQAVKALKASGPAASDGGLAGRMAARGNPNLRGGATGGGAKSSDERLVEFAKQRAEKSRSRRR